MSVWTRKGLRRERCTLYNLEGCSIRMENIGKDRMQQQLEV